MPETPRILPIYHVSDATMLERLATIQDLFADDLADFTAFDGDFDATFRDAWTADREAAEAMPTDESVQDELAVLTEAVNAAMAAGRDKWREIKYFVDKAFPGSPATLRVFGSDDYEKKCHVQKEFIGWLENLHTKAQATAYKPKLLAANYKQPQIDEIATLRDNLFTANKAQEDWKKERFKATEDRRIALNRVYTTLVQVNKAAQVIYINSAAKRAQYVFDPNGEGGSDPATYIGSLGGNEKKDIATVPYSTHRNISLQNTGSTPVALSLSVASGEVEANSVTAAPGETVERTMQELNDATAATIVVVWNKGADPGAYIVTIG